MMRITVSKGADALVSYFTSSLTKDDYFFGERATDGYWHGALAKILGLPERVSKKTFTALARNRHPVTGGKLTVRDAASRRTAIEYMFSAPKSVSVVMALTKDRTILTVHRRAVRKAMAAIEADMRTQVRVHGRNTYVKTGATVYARFDHFTARPVHEFHEGRRIGVSDPLLHSHCIVMNCTRYKDRYVALEASTIHRQAGYYEALYHAHLALGLQRAGYDIVRTGARYEIRGITRAVIDKFSRRTQQIERVARARGITDARRKAALGARTRLSKRAAGNADLQRLWRARLAPAEARAIGAAKGTPRPARPGISAKEAVERALTHALERQAAVRVKTVLTEAMRLGYGSLSPRMVRAELRRRDDILYARERAIAYLTTKTMVRAENRMIAWAAETKNTMPPIHAEYRITRDFLNEGQRRAIRRILRSADRVCILSGAAGVGKSTLLEELREAAAQKNRSVFAFAPSAGASRGVLRSKGFAKADTIARFLVDRDSQRRTRGQIILIDEASLVGVHTMNRIFGIARTQNARVILSGDVRQHGSVEAGSALRQLQDKARLEAVTVDGIIRQRGNPAYRAAIEHLAAGRTADGFRALDRMGAIIEINDTARRHAQIAEAYLQSVAQSRSALIISPTHKEGVMITAAVREAMRARERGQTPERRFTIYRPLPFTDAHKQDHAVYEVGMSVQFHQNAKGGIRAGQRYRVSAVRQTGQVVLAPQNGPERFVLPRETPGRFQVFRAGTIVLAAGETIRITHNGRTVEKTRVHNGQRVTIAGFTPGGDIRLGTGKTLSRDFGHITYGYVETSHSAQGKDSRDVIIAQSAMSFAAGNQKQFYVSASRATDTVRIFTDDKAALRSAIMRPGEPPTAREIAARHRRRIRTHQRVRAYERSQRKPNIRERTKQPGVYAPRTKL